MGDVVSAPRLTAETCGELHRTFSRHVRAEMGAMRLSGRAVATKAGMSHNYLAKRLRDEAPFTLDDIQSIEGALGKVLLCRDFRQEWTP